jgi:carotenoid cleavage dioxygenase-like enzyme
MANFSSMRQMTGYFSPTRFEADIFDCEVNGEVPSDLDGAFYRLHHDWFYPPLFPDDTHLSGDGYLSALRFRNGTVHYRGRYVRTDRYKRQRAAQRSLYGRYRNPYSDDASVRDLERPGRRTTANTTPAVIGGRLYATKEEGLPYEIDPNTLETLGECNFDGQWKSETFTAHPKRDPDTGETFAFGFEATGITSRDVFVYTFDREGRITREVRCEAPYTTMLHDMSITANYIIIPGGGCVTDISRLKQGKPHWGWDSEKPSYFLVIPRSGDGTDYRVFLGPERSIIHTLNAHDAGSRIVLDLPAASGNTWPFFDDVHGKPFEMHENTIRRVSIDFQSGNNTIEEEELFELPVTSFTRIDERFYTKPNRYAFVQFADRKRPFDAVLPDDPRAQPNNSYGRFDLIDRKMTSYFAGSAHVLQEPVFVPRSADAPEGDGYLLGTIHSLADMRTEIVVISAKSMEAVAHVVLPFRNAPQIHGIWADATVLPLT